MSERLDPRKQFELDLAARQSNLRYSTVIELLSQESYDVTDVETLVNDADQICEFVFKPYDRFEAPTVGAKPEEAQPPLPFNDGAYL